MKKEHKEYTTILLRELGISEDEHSEFIFNKGIEYLEEVCGVDPELKRLQQSKLIWNWWTEQWYARNYYLCCEFAVSKVEESSDVVKEAMREAFYDIHDVTSKKIFPSKILLENSFAEVIGQYIDTLHNQNMEVRYVNLR